MAKITIRDMKKIEKKEGTVKLDYLIGDDVAFTYELILSAEIVDKMISSQAKTQSKMTNILFNKGKVNSLNVDEKTLVSAFQKLSAEDVEEITQLVNREILDYVLGDAKEELTPLFQEMYGEGLVEYKMYLFLEKIYDEISVMMGK